MPGHVVEPSLMFPIRIFKCDSDGLFFVHIVLSSHTKVRWCKLSYSSARRCRVSPLGSTSTQRHRLTFVTHTAQWLPHVCAWLMLALLLCAVFLPSRWAQHWSSCWR